MFHYFFLSVDFWFWGMAYNIYQTYMHDQQCWASLPGHTLVISNAFFRLNLSVA